MRFDITSRTLIASGARPIHAGDHYDYRFALTEEGSPLSLEGAKIWFTVKESDTDSDADAKLQLTSDEVEEIEVPTPITGVFYLHLAPVMTEDLTGTWLYDLQIRRTSGAVVTVAYGAFEFLPNVTKTFVWTDAVASQDAVTIADSTTVISI